jgi:hypothetical protein
VASLWLPPSVQHDGDKQFGVGVRKAAENATYVSSFASEVYLHKYLQCFTCIIGSALRALTDTKLDLP